MATVTGNMYCCDDCAMSIANGDTSGLDYHGDDYRAAWEAGVAATSDSLPEGYPVVSCPEGCTGESKNEFNCDFCSRDVYSHKFVLVFLN
ncbi:gp45 [Mycobacterium phage Predator]|uniref:Uncharacterized protein n=1 Tax=Mycobacterium phage Predator TaxID=543153 RepID=B3VM72_9CAUD|nr:gp45 [Mycobacterium phage Predator]ACF05142.1 hypothetical protein PREDATOR_45 [Mycobacterium phage Predator]